MKLIREITGFDLSLPKQRWKLFLFGFASLIVLASLYFTDGIVRKIAEDERRKAELWAEAIQRRAGLVKYQEELFESIKREERKRVEVLAMVYRRLIDAEESAELNFITEVLNSNTSIPVLLTDEYGEIYNEMNLEPRFRGKTHLEGELLEYFSDYPPIAFVTDPLLNTRQFIYYRDSRLFTELRDVMDDLVESFFNDVVMSAANIPVIVVDSTLSRIIIHGNIDDFNPEDSLQTQNLIRYMAVRNQPVSIVLPNYGTCHVFYANSFLLTQLRYYPLAQFVLIGIFLLVAYMLFSIARNAEQNLVWVGMSKETAHQLGTPLSSLLGWVELLRMKNADKEAVDEIRKDLQRLENITERFSKIGSAPKLELCDLNLAVNDSVAYMRTRSPKKVLYRLETSPEELTVPLNTHLFGWVIENIIKNAIDAMAGDGLIRISVSSDTRFAYVDISDTGKGIPVSRFKSIFKPGYTSKSRGWGLGLSLAKRIIENYHKGKLFVKESTPGKGSIFRILLKRV